MKDNKYFVVALTYIFFTYIKNGIPYKNRQRKHNKLSDMPFTTIILKVTNPFNIETHYMLSFLPEIFF